MKSSFTDRSAYLMAGAAALSWFVHIRYPALLPGGLRETAHICLTAAAALTAGVMMAKHMMIDGYSGLLKEYADGNESLKSVICGLEKALKETIEERDRAGEREAALKCKLKGYEQGPVEAQLSALRKKIRADEDDRKTSLAFLVHELKNRLNELENVDDQEIDAATVVLKKETMLIENEIKKGGMSFYELVISINEVREHLHDLTLIRLQSASGQRDEVREHLRAHDFQWFSHETDPTRIDRIYKFLKVAFHPDRFSSERLKEEAKVHFQEAVQAYSTFKERLRTTH